MNSTDEKFARTLNKPLVVAQLSDSHLFCDTSGLHCGVNVYQNLLIVLRDIKNNSVIDIIVFTGDLTQDHSHESYKLFAEAISLCQISIPVFFVAGNHDDPILLNDYLKGSVFNHNKIIETCHWQIILLDSKSDTPSGYISKASFDYIESAIDSNKFQLIFMHHHPVVVGYFIDKHGLNNAEEFWNVIDCKTTVKGIACGHIHRGMTLLKADTNRSIDVYTCPATSIQFDPSSETMKALDVGPGYRIFNLLGTGTIETSLKYFN